MSRRLTRISLVLAFFLSSDVWAIGLGDIHLDSALNEPLRAEIELLSATPEELASLTITLASPETFERYGIDRPFYLQQIAFNVDSRPNGAVIQVRSATPITEPFLTFLVEATWSAGRLLREYTVLLDPPTYSPPAVQQQPAIEAPRRATPTDSGRIERQQPVSRPEPQPEPRPAYTPPSTPAPAIEDMPSEAPAAAADEDVPVYEEAPAYEEEPSYETPYSTTEGGDYYVERGDTLWGITTRLRPDTRLSINQTMISIFEANPQAFEGNINRLKAGATLRIPSADNVFQISRRDAFVAVKRMNDEWRGTTTTADTGYEDTAYEEPSAADTGYDAAYEAEAAAEPETETSLVLVPPDEEPAGVAYDDTLDSAEAPTREQEIADRIAELEAADVPDQQSLIEIRDNELAALRQELAEIRGEVYEPSVPTGEDILADDEIQAEEAEPVAADEAEAAEEEAAAEQPAVPTNVVRTPRASEPGIMDTVIGILGSIWTKIIAALLVVAGIGLWLVRRRGGEEEDSWETVDRDEIAAGAMSATETLKAPTPDESFVVVEQDSGADSIDATVETPAHELPFAAGGEETGQFDSLEDTFSSETAINLDQTDPIAEADFHMAYGLYDQAADLITGALETEPGDKTLMAKLCEIYFVWGNRDAFVDAAGNLKDAVGEDDSAEWDKIVIMGQQIAADHEMFAGAGVAGATRAVDLSFEAEMDEAAELDMDFGAAATGESEIVDLGAAEPESDDDGLDFLFDDEATTEAATAEMIPEEPTAEMPGEEPTAEMPLPVEPTVETPTIEDQFADFEGTSELPSFDEPLEPGIPDDADAAEHTAEINLDELDLDVEGLDETELASLDDLDATGTNEILEDRSEITGKNPEVDPDATGVQQSLDPDATGLQPALEEDADDLADLMGFDDINSTGMRLAPDETGRMPTLDLLEETDTSIDIDADLLEATGKTQVLSEDMAVDTGIDLDGALSDDEETLLASADDEFDDDDETTAIASDAETLVATLDDDEATEVSGDAETLLAPLDDDDEDFDFAKTEALPPDAFTNDVFTDVTSEMPAVAGTDVDLDLDDLTAALQVSGGGDTIEQLRDDATVEQPRPSLGEETAEVPTMSFGPDDMSDDLLEARTMTEVGTKLDLARAYVDMGDPAGARSILEEVLDEGDEGQRQQAQQLLDSLPS
jgi:pilus assembly protein FimV